MQALDAEIRQLRQKARQLEDQLDVNFGYLQEHSGSMFVRSLLPKRIEGESLTGVKLLDTFLQNERLQKILIRLADRLAERIGEGLNWLVDRVFKK
jgi:hypothetical protein